MRRRSMNAEAARVSPFAAVEAKDHSLVPADVRDRVAKGSVLYEKRAVKDGDG